MWKVVPKTMIAGLVALPTSVAAGGIQDDVASVVAHAPAASGAQRELTFRGALSTSLQEYPFAAVTTAFPGDISDVAESEYGIGGFFSLTYAHSNAFNGYGVEASLSYMQLHGDDAVGERPPGTAACAPSIYDVFTLSHGACMDGAEVSNTATAIQGRLLATRDTSSSTRLLGGLGFVSFENSINGEMIFPGELSIQRRENDFHGLGIVVGARHSAPISSTWNLGVEGFGGVYWGDRDVSIRDNYVGTVGSFDQSEAATVHSLDLAISLERDTMMFGRDGRFEFGLAYNALYGAVDTANYNPTFAVGEDSPTGDTSDNFDAVSLYVGYSMKF